MMAAHHNASVPDRPRFSLRTLLTFVTVVAVCIGLLSASASYLVRREALKQAELARLAALDKATAVAIVEEVEAIRTKLGRAPTDEAELELHLGRKMPWVHDGVYPVPIRYRCTGDDSFILKYELWATDDWIYDSTLPSAGWVQHWY